MIYCFARAPTSRNLPKKKKMCTADEGPPRDGIFILWVPLKLSLEDPFYEVSTREEIQLTHYTLDTQFLRLFFISS